MKEKVSELFKDKLYLVMLVLGLLTIVAAAGVVTIRRGSQIEESPYLQIEGEEQLAESELLTEPLQVAGNSDAKKQSSGSPEISKEPERVKTEKITEIEIETETETETEKPAKAVGIGQEKVKSLVLDFSDSGKLLWPVEGNVILDYSMDSTIYFPTLEQYKCNPGIVVQGEISTPVVSPANARVISSGVNEEIGNYLELDIGNGYSIICGQLKESAAVTGEYLEKGQTMGYIAEPTKYYTIEGSNIYIQMMHNGTKVDPLDYLE